MNFRQISSLVFFFFVFTSACSQEVVTKIDADLETPIRLDRIKMLRTDNITVDSLNIQSKEWKEIQIGENINPVSGIYWLFTEIQIAESPDFEKELTLNLSHIGLANEVYWDEKLIGKKGVIGQYDENAGESDNQVVRVPYDYATQGNHRLIIKVYNGNIENVSVHSHIEIGYDHLFIEREVEQKYLMIFFMAILFAAAIFNLVLFFGFNKNIAYLFFSLYCLTNSRRAYQLPFTMIESFESALALDYSSISVIMYILSGFSLFAYLITRFSFHRTQKVFSVFVLLLPLIGFFLPQSRLSELIHFILISLLPFVIVLYALFKKKEDSLYILLGIIGINIFLFLGIAGVIGNGYFFGISFFVIVISILSSKEIAVQNRKHREAVLRAARLEIELLKRNIQPHFILNTLTSLQELVEQNPQKASKFIQSLAEEFQLFSKVSGEKLILISDELKLCNAHLRIMEYRKGAKFELSTQGVDGTEKIPPGIFHTLIENGTSHGYLGRQNGKFNITKETGTGCTRFIVFNDSESEEIPEEIKKGTGMKYIEARLEESFPGYWKLSSGQVKNGWEVKIEIYKKE
ncbi:sensor histidine kinase [candidate division KSB1 bacterium]